MKNAKQTSRRVATVAGSVLANPKASKKDKALAGSALAQTAGKRRKRS